MKRLTLVLIILKFSVLFGQKHIVAVQLGGNPFNLKEVKTSSSFYNSKITEITNYRVGLSGALSYEYRINFGFQFGTKLRWSNKKVTKTFEYINTSGEIFKDEYYYELIYNHLNTDFTVGYNLGKNKFNIFLNVGLSPSFLVNGKINLHNHWSFENESLNFNDDVNRFNLGWLVELGVNYELTEKLAITSILSYRNYINKDADTDEYLEPLYKYLDITFNLGIRYHLNSSENDKLKTKKGDSFESPFNI